MIKILFLTANPTDTTRLKLDEECRAIDKALRQTEFRDLFDLRPHPAVRVTDIHELLLRHKPDIVHFSGHGSDANEIILQDSTGLSHPVSLEAIEELFSILSDNIRCVILNACYTKEQAEAIAKHVDCVIGMSNAFSDSAAISFAAAFYQALGFGRDIKIAFRLGCSQINLENLREQNIPQLHSVRTDPSTVIFTESQNSPKV